MHLRLIISVFLCSAISAFAGDELPEPVVISSPAMVHGAGEKPQVARALLFSPDGRILVSAGTGPNGVCFWDAQSGAALGAVEILGRDARAVAFSANGSVLATVGEEEVSVIDTASRAVTAHWPAPAAAAGIALSADGKIVAVGGHVADLLTHVGLIEIHDSHSGQLLGSMQGHKIGVRYLAFSQDGKLLATAIDAGDFSGDNSAIVWDVAQRKQKQQITVDHPSRPYPGLLFVPPDVKVGQSPFMQSHPIDDDLLLQGATPATFAPAANRAIVFGDCGPTVVDLAQNKPLYTLMTPSGQEPTVVALAPIGLRAAGADAAGHLYLWTTDRAAAEKAGKLPSLRLELLMSRTQFLLGEPIVWGCRISNLSDHAIPIYADPSSAKRAAVLLHLDSLGRQREVKHMLGGQGIASPRELAPGTSIEMHFDSVGPDMIAAGHGDTIALPEHATADVAYVEYLPPPDAPAEANVHVLSQPLRIMRSPGSAFSHPVYCDWVKSTDGVISVRIHTDSALYGHKADVFIHGEIRNNTNHDITISAPQDEIYASLEVEGPDGKLPSPEHRRRQPRLVVLHADDSMTVSGLLDASRFPGLYELGEHRISYTFASHNGIPEPPDNLWEGTVRVGPVTLWRVMDLPDAPPAATQPAAH